MAQDLLLLSRSNPMVDLLPQVEGVYEECRQHAIQADDPSGFFPIAIVEELVRLGAVEFQEGHQVLGDHTVGLLEDFVLKWKTILGILFHGLLEADPLLIPCAIQDAGHLGHKRLFQRPCVGPLAMAEL
eukprot:CAMPEP_0177255494 /NCGR_PEP_ID=MMETSP0367-20130122/56392_1 /TAXON_ID=447022 ORGANISM="Scrippsiella hangoei-like, Strain SHHI-4" /NCGR_SAMPLE_ID=MMETSP0367 /ASSEMBLY_ACC=CAM_ASM_000362 /LENGTH=128 /DNA_ID=CAMNT_0018709223 /DNA_START=236 /DNA_END=619 /DNA_ORIENTATION=-